MSRQIQLYQPMATAKFPHKYAVYVKGKNGNPKLIYFGDRRYKQYHDVLGCYSNQDHGNLERRRNYRKRSEGIKDKYGNPTYKNINSANYWSYHYLW